MLKKPIRNILAALGALALMSGAAAAQSKVTIAIGGAGCLCYLPTVLAAFVIAIDWLVTLVENRLLVWRPVAAETRT